MSQHTLLTALAIVRAGWAKGQISSCGGKHCLLGAILKAHDLPAANTGMSYVHLSEHSEVVADVELCAQIIRERIEAIGQTNFGWRTTSILNPSQQDYETCFDYNDSTACTQGDVELILDEAAKRAGRPAGYEPGVPA